MSPWLKNALTMAGVLAALMAPVYFFMETHNARHDLISEYVAGMEKRANSLIRQITEIKCLVAPDSCDGSLNNGADNE